MDHDYEPMTEVEKAVAEVRWGSEHVAERAAVLRDAEMRHLKEFAGKHPNASTKWYRRRIADALVAMARLDGASAVAQLQAALDDVPRDEQG